MGKENDDIYYNVTIMDVVVLEDKSGKNNHGIRYMFKCDLGHEFNLDFYDENKFKDFSKRLNNLNKNSKSLPECVCLECTKMIAWHNQIMTDKNKLQN